MSNPSQNADFWSSEFDYAHREDGTILMKQRGTPDAYSPILADYLDHWADTTPDTTWIARRDHGGDWRRISYGQGRAQIRSIGAALLAMGLGPDRPLLILSENSLEHALLGMACAYVGVPYAPLSPAYSLMSKDFGKVRDIAALLSPGAIFADDGAAFGDAIAAIKDSDTKVINLSHPTAGAVTFDSLLQADPAGSANARAALSPERTVKYLFTSGSTGSPKAVINTNQMICAMEALVRDCYRFLTKNPPVVLDWAPWNHTAGGNKVFYMVMTNGGSYYIDDGRPVPGKFDETLRNLRELSCTWYFNVPVGYDMLIEALEADPALAKQFFGNLGMMFYAGAGMAQRTWDRLRAAGRAATGHEVLLATGLGATETAPFALACTEPQEKSGNVGVPARELTLKLVPSGDKLEARLKGPTITPGYYGDPAKTADAFDEEGFYRMGDALRPADPDDFSKGFFFDGRIAENFKLNTGTWVSVGAVRAKLVDAMDGLIKDAVITGEDQSQLGAMLILSDTAARMNVSERHRLLTEKLGLAAKAATGSASRVRRAIILQDLPSFDRGEVTEKGSLNQRALRNNRTDTLARLYSDDPDVIRV
ncbi:feruloyl-CoA synthase [Yoonia sediminilitoris]|uniref:Trans-feruloyl-CoA synthase n=1 Tax=Yoonia sediminilitoris TaxID=1286148 RepID=A0A2T6KQZ6_9RHOB|nr:feruloyl-CoA synthase [Yoonia sediminilitoris]PUB18983.1 trans-feruloyl-CoA synthase [Yoonia sediminilitoris]RCW99151.1 feruloyl-CoA synthase [Yoonia sediminilitoris]